ncbi:MAG TPA: Gfo/Idh/MocA family oxidoreductase [Abditibacteriaceae bacterium]|nr:Gfo/Idh/MocA family oxidoreductase [Abditibacteriaceae bacterium]
MKRWKFAGINFDHMHMGDLLRQVSEHPDAEVVGICDEDASRMESTAQALTIPAERIYTDYTKCLEATQPDAVILCPSTAQHGEWVEKVAPFGTHILVEKPMAASLQEADAMIEAMRKTGKTLVINWPLAWYPPHLTSKRLIDEGVIGQVREVHYYDGNRGPLHHLADKVEVSEEEVARRKGQSWWYQSAAGGGSLLDYLGYGTTLGTWFHGGRAPLEVTCAVDQQAGLEVDEHSVTVARYENGLSKFETRWGTFTDPWTNQPQPKCGFVIVGSKGTIASYDYENTIRVQTDEHPAGREIAVDEIAAPMQNAIQHLVDVMQNGSPVHGPLQPALCRIGQQIVDSAALSAREKRTVQLLD